MFNFITRLRFVLLCLTGLLLLTGIAVNASTVTATVGQSVTFSVTANGTAPFTYQWYKGGSVVSGATSGSYVISNVQATGAGVYTAVVSNSYGSTTSDSATLTVNTTTGAPVFVTQPVSQSVTAGGSITFTVAANGSPAPTYQWMLNGTSLSGATSASLTISNAQSANAGSYSVVATNSVGSLTSSTATLTVNAVVGAPYFTTQPAGQTVAAGSPVTFTVVAYGAATYQWQKNGVNIAGATSASYTISNVAAGDAGSYHASATNSGGTAWSNSAVLTVTAGTSAPVFTAQPAGQVVTVGGSVTFTAAASGSPAPSYQWRLNGTNIAAATSASLTLTNVQLANAGNYTVVATNSAGSATSTTASLTVNSAPVFTTQPASRTATTGTSVTFTAAASGTPSPTFKWKRNGATIGGATSASYTIASAQPANAGTYTVVATNSVGSTTSNSATLTVNAAATAPVITTQPVNMTAAVGSSVTFTAAASGSPTPTYQWRLNGTTISGATSASYTIANAQAANAGTYTVVATNSAGTATSSAASLTVNSMPVITTQPASQTVSAGSPVTFAVVASGLPAPTYQWRKDGANITGATGASYSIASMVSGNAGTYTVVVTNSAGSVTSSGAILALRAAVPAIVTRIDFNGDGKSDILWQDIVTGKSYVWLMSGTSVSSTVILGMTSTTWQIAGAGDFNRDGQSDILWQNNATGECIIWLMSGTNCTSMADLGVISTDWQLCGSGDFNGDGQSDLLWQNRVTGDRTIWLMSGTTPASIIDLGMTSTEWQICGSGDFNGDGKSDILVQDVVTGQVSVWLMAGTTVGSVVPVGILSADWDVGGTGDYNADSQSDILLQNAVTGECKVWLMNGTTVGSTVSLGTVALSMQVRN